MTLPGVDFAAIVATDRQMTHAMLQKVLLRQQHADQVYARRKLRQRQVVRWARNLGLLSTTLVITWSVLHLYGYEPVLHFGDNAHPVRTAPATQQRPTTDSPNHAPSPVPTAPPSMDGNGSDYLQLRLDNRVFSIPANTPHQPGAQHEQH